MANCRFLSRFELDSSNNQIHITDNTDHVGGFSFTLDAGLYYFSLDDSTAAGALDFGLELESKLDNAFSSSAPWEVQIANVNSGASSATAGGRIVITSALATWTLNISNPLFTLDPRILGFADGADQGSGIYTFIISDYVHRYGWYPAAPAYDDEAVTQKMTASASESTSGFVDIVHFRTYEEANIVVEYVPTALIRERGAANADRANQSGLTQNDPNASLERFHIDIVENGLEFRYYKAITAYTIADYDGPYKIPGSSPLYRDPLSTSSQPFSNADYWNTRVDGREVAT